MSQSYLRGLFVLERIVVVGGIPEPIGGVTSFISRLLSTYPDLSLIDIYPGLKKNAPLGHTGEIVYLNGFFSLLFHLFFCVFFKEKKIYFFNFSRLYAVFLIFFVPKMGSKFLLMLHHGNIKTKVPSFIVRVALKKFNRIFSINSSQEVFFLESGIDEAIIFSTSSYVPLSRESIAKSLEVDNFFYGGKVFVVSGFPRDYYNIQWCVDYVVSRKEFKLAIFLYGDGELKEVFRNLNHERIKVFFDTPAATFNYALSMAYFYLRPTKVDSFGVAVADAVSLGVPAFCSDVCERYGGAYVFKIDGYSGFSRDLDLALSGRGVKSIAGEKFFHIKNLLVNN